MVVSRLEADVCSDRGCRFRRNVVDAGIRESIYDRATREQVFDGKPAVCVSRSDDGDGEAVTLEFLLRNNPLGDSSSCAGSRAEEEDFCGQLGGGCETVGQSIGPHDNVGTVAQLVRLRATEAKADLVLGLSAGIVHTLRLNRRQAHVIFGYRI